MAWKVVRGQQARGLPAPDLRGFVPIYNGVKNAGLSSRTALPEGSKNVLAIQKVQFAGPRNATLDEYGESITV